MSRLTLEAQLNLKVQEGLTIITDFERCSKQAEALSVQLGKILVDLQTLFYRVHKNKKSGFIKWAAEKFERSPKTIDNYMRYARNPEALKREQTRQRAGRNTYVRTVVRSSGISALDTIKKVFETLTDSEKLEFVAWADEQMLKRQQNPVPRIRQRPGQSVMMRDTTPA